MPLDTNTDGFRVFSGNNIKLIRKSKLKRLKTTFHLQVSNPTEVDELRSTADNTTLRLELRLWDIPFKIVYGARGGGYSPPKRTVL